MIALCFENRSDKELHHLQERRIFTLVELLVVVAIMGILLTMLLPALRNAREISKRASCQSNMKQIGLGVIQYTGDYGGWIPCRGAVNNGGTWTQGLRDAPGAIAAYIPLKMWECPSAKFETYTKPSFHIGWEAAMGYQGLCTWKNLKGYQVPSRTIYAGDMLDPALLPSVKSHYYAAAYFWDSLGGSMDADFRHAGSWNGLFLDGHVKSLASKTAISRECQTLYPDRY